MSLVASPILAWKIHWIELVLATVAGVGLAVATVFVTYNLLSIAPAPDCGYAPFSGEITGSAGCADQLAKLAERSDAQGGVMAPLLLLFPILAGSFVGSQLVASEIEHETAQLVWPLFPSRAKWLGRSALWLGLALLPTLVLLAFVSDALESARAPWLHDRIGFMDYGLHGGILAMRGIAAFCTGILGGTLLSRGLPAAVVSMVAAIVLAQLVFVARPFAVASEPLDRSTSIATSYVTEHFLEDRAGRRLTFDQAVAQSGASDPDSLQQWIESNLTERVIGIAGDRVGEVTLREGGVLLIGSAAMLAVTSLVLRHRKPY